MNEFAKYVSCFIFVYYFIYLFFIQFKIGLGSWFRKQTCRRKCAWSVKPTHKIHGQEAKRGQSICEMDRSEE